MTRILALIVTVCALALPAPTAAADQHRLGKAVCVTRHHGRERPCLYPHRLGVRTASWS